MSSSDLDDDSKKKRWADRVTQGGGGIDEPVSVHLDVVLLSSCDIHIIIHVSDKHAYNYNSVCKQDENGHQNTLRSSTVTTGIKHVLCFFKRHFVVTRMRTATERFKLCISSANFRCLFRILRSIPTDPRSLSQTHRSLIELWGGTT